MHLADAFIQSYTYLAIQAIHMFLMCFPWEFNLLRCLQCSTTEPQEHMTF